MGEEQEEQEQICPFCIREFKTVEELREHATKHNALDVYRSFDARLESRLDEFATTTGKVTADLVSKLATVFDGRIKKIEERSAERPREAEPMRETESRGETGPSEVSMGETARLEEGARAVAEGARRAGITIRGEDIGPILGGLGQLAMGLRGSSRGEDPFSEAGRAMFNSFARAMSEATARVLGRRIGEEVVEHE